MIASRWETKLTHGAFDGTSKVQPDASYDTSKGYSAGSRLLVIDGTSWVCESAATAAAVWNQDTSDDAAIDQACLSLTDSVTRYLDNLFIATNVDRYRGTVAWTKPDELILIDGSFGALEGDTIIVSGASRNDGFYDVLTNSLDVLTISPEFAFEVEDDGVLILVSVFPRGLRDVCARMAAFDVWERNKQGVGIDSESIGSYSWTKGPVSAGYPSDMVSGLMAYKRPKIR